MRDFKFTESERPTMANFNARFDAIAALANGLGNEYVWEKQTASVSYDTITNHTDTNDYSVITKGSTTFVYGDTLEEVFSGRGKTATVNPTSTSSLSFLIGKYFKTSSTGHGYTSTTDIYFAPSNAKVSLAYSSNEYRILPLSQYVNPKVSYETIGYVNSPDQAAYPPAVSDGYTYTALGQLGAKVQIATGSYTGTGTYGKSNPNRLTFGFRPRFLAISTLGLYSSAEQGKLNAGSQKIELWYMEHTWGRSNFNLGTADMAKWIDDKTIEWYTTSTSGNPAIKQYNYEYGYIYIAIG